SRRPDVEFVTADLGDLTVRLQAAVSDNRRAIVAVDDNVRLLESLVDVALLAFARFFIGVGGVGVPDLGLEYFILGLPEARGLSGDLLGLRGDGGDDLTGKLDFLRVASPRCLHAGKLFRGGGIDADQLRMGMR